MTEDLPQAKKPCTGKRYGWTRKKDYSVEVYVKVLTFFDKNKERADAWMGAVNPMLGEVSPDAMLRIGRGAKLLEFVDHSLAENADPRMVVVDVRGGLVERVRGPKPEKILILNFDVPEDKSMWDDEPVCMGCAYHREPATHG